ncbi:hypothetical protein GCM10023259_103430 [Thermocatellispora tengchongensis]|uniref:polysaccharide pyruvyl transferase family protein n=1 Tax=Thermocatellispora tengchongensis TaxID=1073253 RepID=UPI0031E802E6
MAFKDLAEIQQETLRALGNHLGGAKQVALLDFPRHFNSGDSLIWLGTKNYLSRLGVEVSYEASLHYFNPRELRRVYPEGPILIHGGGNFGDRWPDHQAFREKVIESFPDRQIIQLPQTMDFDHVSGRDRAAQVLANHGNVVLLLRERAAVDEAREAFPGTTVDFCPDLALGLGYQEALGQTTNPVVQLLRLDRESTAATHLPRANRSASPPVSNRPAA